MSQNDKLELFSKLFDFEKRGNNYMAKSDGAVITIYQNGNHQIQGKNVDYAKKMIDFLLRKSDCESFGGHIFSTLELSIEINPNLKEKALNAIIKALDEIDPENIVFVKN